MAMACRTGRYWGEAERPGSVTWTWFPSPSLTFQIHNWNHNAHCSQEGLQGYLGKAGHTLG